MSKNELNVKTANVVDSFNRTVTKITNVTFYGGSDACQGDSGGPL